MIFVSYLDFLFTKILYQRIYVHTHKYTDNSTNLLHIILITYCLHVKNIFNIKKSQGYKIFWNHVLLYLFLNFNKINIFENINKESKCKKNKFQNNVYILFKLITSNELHILASFQNFYPFNWITEKNNEKYLNHIKRI